MEKIFTNEEQNYKRPSIDLLNDYENIEESSENCKEIANKIIKRMKSLGVDLKLVSFNIGPTFTRYAFDVPANVKMSMLNSFINDVKAATELSRGVIMYAPLPGTKPNKFWDWKML